MWRREGEKKKRNKCWSVPPLMTNMQTHTHTQSAAPKTATFPASFPRGGPEGKGIFSGRGGRLTDGVESIGPAISGCLLSACCPGCLCLCGGAFVSLHQLLDNVLFFPVPPFPCCTECLEEDGCKFLCQSCDWPSRLLCVDFCVLNPCLQTWIQHYLYDSQFEALKGPRFDTHL